MYMILFVTFIPRSQIAYIYNFLRVLVAKWTQVNPTISTLINTSPWETDSYCPSLREVWSVSTFPRFVTLDYIAWVTWGRLSTIVRWALKVKHSYPEASPERTCSEYAWKCDVNFVVYILIYGTYRLTYHGLYFCNLYDYIVTNCRNFMDWLHAELLYTMFGFVLLREINLQKTLCAFKGRKSPLRHSFIPPTPDRRV